MNDDVVVMQRMINDVVGRIESSIDNCSYLSRMGGVEYYSTGVAILNKLISGSIEGGIPSGRIVEICGDEGSGKTTLGLKILSETQKKGGLAVLFDTELSLNMNWMMVLGIDPNSLLYFQVSLIEQIIDLIERIDKIIRKIDKKLPVTIMWDSIAATSTLKELEEGFGVETMHSKLISKVFSKFKKLMINNVATFIGVNQIRNKINGLKFRTVSFANKAVKSSSSICIELRKMGVVMKDSIPVALKVKTKITKNKLCASIDDCVIVIDFKKGIDDVASCVYYLLEKGILKQEDGYIKYNGMKFMVDDMVEYFSCNYDELCGLFKDN